MRPRPIPAEALDYYEEQVRAGKLAKDICRELRDMYPDAFGGTGVDNVSVRMRRQFHDEGREIPDAIGNYNRSRANRSFTDQRPELIIPYQPRVLVCSDFHFPVHSERVVERAIDTVNGDEIETVVFNGDQLNNDYKGHKAHRDAWMALYEEGVDKLRHFTERLSQAGASKLVVVMGNHDDKGLRDTDLEQSWNSWWSDVLADSLDGYEDVWIAERYRAIMEPKDPDGQWPYRPENFPTRFSHQKNYGQNPGTVARKLAGKYLSHMVCGHQHHGSISKHMSNMFMALDAPCGADPELAGYKELRDTGHPEWNPGFLTLIDHTPTLYDLS